MAQIKKKLCDTIIYIYCLDWYYYLFIFIEVYNIVKMLTQYISSYYYWSWNINLIIFNKIFQYIITFLTGKEAVPREARGFIFNFVGVDYQF